MVLDSHRDKAEVVLLPVAKKFRNVNPNLLTWIALLSAVLAGIFFYLAGSYLFILLGAFMVLFNSFFDALDGRVAKLAGKASKKGDFLDHAFDRYADIFIIGGIAFGPLCRLWIGVLALLGVLMTSYMGTQAHAVGVGRNYGGIAGRADRLILLIFVPIIFVILDLFYTSRFIVFEYRIGFMELLMIWLAVTGHLTAVHRGVSSWNELDSKEKDR